MSDRKVLLPEHAIADHWYNVVADMPNPPAPVLGPDGHPDARALAALFASGVMEQEVSAERWIPIPEEVRDIYRLWRPSPLHRAPRLEDALGTPAHIYYKYEGVSPAGSHKPKSAVAQAYYNRQEGIVPAPESNHAIAAVIAEARRCKETGEPKTLFFNLSGHGHFDMAAYDRFLVGELEDREYPEGDITTVLARLPVVK